jgi:hypothetical protein
MSPSGLLPVSVSQFVERLTDRQAAHGCGVRIDWKYALGLELPYGGFDHSVLCESVPGWSRGSSIRSWTGEGMSGFAWWLP